MSQQQEGILITAEPALIVLIQYLDDPKGSVIQELLDEKNVIIYEHVQEQVKNHLRQHADKNTFDEQDRIDEEEKKEKQAAKRKRG